MHTSIVLMENTSRPVRRNAYVDELPPRYIFGGNFVGEHEYDPPFTWPPLTHFPHFDLEYDGRVFKDGTFYIAILVFSLRLYERLQDDRNQKVAHHKELQAARSDGVDDERKVLECWVSKGSGNGAWQLEACEELKLGRHCRGNIFELIVVGAKHPQRHD
eukprot:CAMPEP_0179458012 /NCGR_PEP_ID=MMETSP0799-20121207/41662_1 /TAXON_ID=46947 /ORGANISM="Geminigera cryophila, Strain CCMP2564" /LENGTH=159 /DNA_ID=CAMNT_0021259037 /DNA_START=995 /DNA_END=1474 /DNA_ORIENTATION=-